MASPQEMNPPCKVQNSALDACQLQAFQPVQQTIKTTIATVLAILSLGHKKKGTFGIFSIDNDPIYRSYHFPMIH